MNLNYFKEKDFFNALNTLFNALNIPTNGGVEEPVTVKEILKDTYKDNDAFSLVRDVYFVGMVDDAAFNENESMSKDEIKSDYDGLLIFGVTLNQRENGDLLPTRSHLAEISRAFNREFYYTPVTLVFKYQDDQDDYLALANTERLIYKQEWREGEKAGKVSLLRDINISNAHSGHQQILTNMSKESIDSFDSLYKHWQTVFSVSLLNKRFYAELSNWYFWAVKEVKFPSEPTMQSMFEKTGRNDEKKLQELKQEHNAKNVIRLLTRLLFVWFIKEKKLVPDELFDLEYIKDNILEELSPIHEDGLFASANTNSHYYKAILQNLFFATLNQEMGKRSFRNDKQHMNVTNLMRYQGFFKNPKKYVDLVESIVPFMNGGLFDCLDKPHPTKKGAKGGDFIVYKDGFSDRNDIDVVVPDYLFFGVDEQVDLSSVIGISNKNTKQAAVKGLINIFNSYKFTISENTPIEEDVALDPELLGKVFENLLASYNPETKTTARKQSGSFYTPREIVNYMVDESLIVYLKNTVFKGSQDDGLDKNLHDLLSFDNVNPFKDNLDIQKQIIEALDKSTILDPACGSGAFPMGVLQKMVHVLDKIDPNSAEWNQRQISKVHLAIESLEDLDDAKFREQGIKDLKEQIKDMEDAFENNELDYGRKLFLIENCIFGVDIQPIAIQISKLRFFISLIVDQKIDKNKENFGIRPLPNLETKFVAANTLVGIKNPDSQLELPDKREVIKLEKELKKVRHKLFSSKVPKRKRELRVEDKNLREKISGLLEREGMNGETARQLAAWDPYEQNTYSPFFDAEWMFDIMDGFDIVIGNPPYGVSIKGEARKVVLKNLRKVPDYEIYYFFIELSKKLLNKNGVLSYIVPNTYLFNVFAKKFREELIDDWEICSLIDFTNYSLFESATVRNSVCVLKKGGVSNAIKYLPTNNENIELVDFINQEVKKLDVSLLREFSQNWALAFKLPISSIKSLAMIKGNSKNLSYFFPEISQGLIAYDKYRGQSQNIIDTRAYHYDKYHPGLKKWLWGGDITKYQIHWNGEEYFDYCEGVANPRNPKYFQGKRMLVREITNPSIFAAVTNAEFYNDPAVLIVKESDYSLEAVALILNSRLGTFYHFNASPKATKGDFPKILVKDIKEFPVTINLESANKSFLRIIYLLAEYSAQHDLYNSIYRSIIDGIVFQLYFPRHMQEKHIDILKFVEKDLDRVMQDRDFESLPDSEKVQIINCLNSGWGDPNGEVLKRINSFSEKSPDILKPILEG